MTNYKELANRLQEPGPGTAAFYEACDQAAAILRSLDVQPQQASKPLSDSHPLAVFAQECAIGAHEYGGLRLAAQNALKAAGGIKERG